MTDAEHDRQQSRLLRWQNVCARLVGQQVTFAGVRVTVVEAYADIVGGLRLDRPVRGCASWNLVIARGGRRRLETLLRQAPRTGAYAHWLGLRRDARWRARRSRG
jgi:uncharacterized protein (DUF3084 family)